MSIPELRLPANYSTVWDVEILNNRLRELWVGYHTLQQSLTTVLYAEPLKLYEGLFAFADGTEWDPGSGRGLYQYVSGGWEKL